MSIYCQRLGCGRSFHIVPGSYEQWAVCKVGFHTGPEKDAPTAFFCPSFEQAVQARQKWEKLFSSKIKGTSNPIEAQALIDRWNECDALLDDVLEIDKGCYAEHTNMVNEVYCNLICKDTAPMDILTYRAFSRVRDRYKNRSKYISRHEVNMQILFPLKKYTRDGRSRRVDDVDKE